MNNTSQTPEAERAEIIRNMAEAIAKREITVQQAADAVQALAEHLEKLERAK